MFPEINYNQARNVFIFAPEDVPNRDDTLNRFLFT